MTQPAKQQAITVGSTRITFLPDGDGRIDKLALFPGTTPESWTLHPEWLDELALFGRNILNNRAVTGALFVLGISYMSQRLREPATFGLTVTVRFGP